MNNIETLIVVDLAVDLVVIYLVVVGILVHKIYFAKTTSTCECCGLVR